MFDQKGKETRSSALIVKCQGKSRCLLSSEDEKDLITSSIQLKKTPLHQSEDVRNIEYIFKFVGSEKYMIVNSSKLNNKFESFEANIWENGVLKFKSIVNARRYFDPARMSSTDRTSVEIKFESGETIRSYSRAPTEPLAVLFSENGTEIPIQELSKKDITPEILIKLGLSKSKFQLNLLRLPCEMLTKSAYYEGLIK